MMEHFCGQKEHDDTEALHTGKWHIVKHTMTLTTYRAEYGIHHGFNINVNREK